MFKNTLFLDIFSKSDFNKILYENQHDKDANFSLGILKIIIIFFLEILWKGFVIFFILTIKLSTLTYVLMDNFYPFL